MQPFVMKVMLEEASNPIIVGGFAPSVTANLCREALKYIEELEADIDSLTEQLYAIME